MKVAMNYNPESAPLYILSAITQHSRVIQQENEAYQRIREITQSYSIIRLFNMVEAWGMR